MALGVAAIPEGIPTAGTTALALASRKLFRRGIIIRKLAAAETLGAVSAVCADKTGTLTLNRMQVTALWLPGDGAITVRMASAEGRGPAAKVGQGLEGRQWVELFDQEGRLVELRRVRDLARVVALNSNVEIGDDGAIRRGAARRGHSSSLRWRLASMRPPSDEGRAACGRSGAPRNGRSW